MTPEIQEAINLAIKKTLAVVGKGVNVATEVVDEAGNVYKLADAKVDKFLVRFAKKDFSTAVIFGVLLGVALGGVVLGFNFCSSPAVSEVLDVLPVLDVRE